MIWLSLVIVVPIFLMLISYVLVSQKKEKFWGWFWWSCLLVGTYFWLLNGISLRFLNPAYYVFKYQCTQLPQPKIYNRDYWDIYINYRELNKLKDENNKKYVYSKQIDKKFYSSLWKSQISSQKTWWGEAYTSQEYYDNAHFATTTTYLYSTFILSLYFSSKDGGFGTSFKKEKLECKNYKRNERFLSF
ncbi:hypothetical protein [Helicobacter kayseriensis]|uniref:hypothetical protein n=1 Tax=Helicobacter kayseriensis TaxID=2905877 RepID=UPI001E522766|nr:hypothetical protein [Helicobacter kayseriensis]MCE3047814.1 hypothetical protein [Helicobacter kayseriensis]MCE3049178.1 hypothetical protein [Helicobacter kayseriensis]